jgi:hypothetical protein
VSERSVDPEPARVRSAARTGPDGSPAAARPESGASFVHRSATLVLGVLALSYVVQRASAVATGPTPLLILGLVIEVTGVLTTIALLVALRPSASTHEPSSGRGPASSPEVHRRIGVVVIEHPGDHPEHRRVARRTTIRSAHRLGPIEVVSADDELGWLDAAHRLGTPDVLVVHAGDVVSPDLRDLIEPLLDQADIGVVDLTEGDHALGVADRLDATWLRRALAPHFDRRGHVVCGGVAFVVRQAIVDEVRRTIQANQHGELAEMWRRDASARLGALLTGSARAAGWKVVTSGSCATVQRDVARHQATGPIASEDRRAADADAAASLVVGPYGIFRRSRLGLGERVDRFAWVALTLSGLRATAAMAVVSVWLLGGSAPWTFERAAAVAGVAWYAGSTVWIWQASGRAIRPGDRLRWSMRMIGSSWREAPAPRERSLGSVLGIHHGVVLTLGCAAVSVAVALRGLSDRVTHTLAPMTDTMTAAALLAALTMLAAGLDALRLLGRPSSRRAHRRRPTTLPSAIDGTPAFIVDITPTGLGLVGHRLVRIGDVVDVELFVPGPDGVFGTLLPVTVRNVSALDDDTYRVGATFGDIDDATLDAVVELSLIGPAFGTDTFDDRARSTRSLSPFRRDRRTDDDHATDAEHDRDDVTTPAPRRVGARVVALVAVTGALASAAPGAVDASSGTVARGRLQLSGAPVAENAALVRSVCADDAGPDDEWGTVDDAYLAPRSDEVEIGAAFTTSLDTTSGVCWLRVAPPVGTMLAGETSAGETPAAARVVGPTTSATDLPTVDLRASTPAAAAGDPGGGVGAASLGARVFVDLDGDGAAGPGEPLIGGIDVAFTDRSGAVVATSTTTSSVATEVSVSAGLHRVHIANLPAGAGVPTLAVTDGVAPSATELADAIFGTSRPIDVPSGMSVIVDVPVASSSNSDVRDLRILPAPPTEMPSPSNDLENLGWPLLTVMLAAIALGVAVVLGGLGGSGSPAASRRRQSTSPDFAIR